MGTVKTPLKISVNPSKFNIISTGRVISPSKGLTITEIQTPGIQRTGTTSFGTVATPTKKNCPTT